MLSGVTMGRPRRVRCVLREPVIDGIREQLGGRMAEYRRVYCPEIDQRTFYEALRGEPVDPGVALAIETSLERAQAKRD